MVQGRVPEHVRDQVRIEVDVAERYVAIVESRPAVAGGVWALSGLSFRSPGALHEVYGVVVTVLARPQPAVSRVRPGACNRERASKTCSLRSIAT